MKIKALHKFVHGHYKANPSFSRTHSIIHPSRTMREKALLNKTGVPSKPPLFLFLYVDTTIRAYPQLSLVNTDRKTSLGVPSE